MSDTVAAAPPAAEPKAAEVVERYIALRDKKAEIKAEYDGKIEAIDNALKRCEAFILQFLDATGGESIRTAAGTAYVSTRTSATSDDWDSTLKFIIENEQWAMLEKRVAKGYVEAYKEAHNDLPPGVSWRAERVVGFRRR